MTARASRRRGAALERAILDAAAAEITQSGYANLTMDRVAQRARTNKNAIYRRWPNRAALALAAYREMATRHLEPPDTGALRTDVLELLRRINGDVNSPRAEVLRGLLAGAAEDPELLQQLHGVGSEPSLAPWLTILERAIARAEVSV